MTLSDKELLELYRWMVMERLFDDKVNSLFRMGKIMSMFHSVLGQEAVNVGAAYALKDGDTFIPSHRGKVIYLMRGMDMNFFMAGLFGKKEGFGQGRVPVGSHMCGDVEIGLLPAEGLVGSSFVVGVGAALALKLQHKPNASLNFVGDGASNRGDVHEGMNFAAALNLPVVFLMINNGWSLSVRASYGLSVKYLSDRAQGYGIPGVTIDGRDVVKVYETVSEAMESARQGKGPVLVEALVDRWSAHSVNDPDLYRTDEERSRVKTRDPLKEFESELQQRSLLTAEDIERTAQELEAEFKSAIEYAESCTEPGIECLGFGLYKDMDLWQK